MEKDKELAMYDANAGLNTLNLFSDDGRKQAEALLGMIIKSDKGGIKTVNEGMAVLLRARDLRLPFSTCIEHIHVINGKTGVDIHVIKSLLSRAGVIWDKVKDYTPQYEYTDGNLTYVETQLPEYCVKCKNKKEAIANAEKDADNVYVYPVAFYKDYQGNVYKEYQLNANFAVAINAQHAQKLMAEKKIPVYRIPPIPCDYVTEYKFTRFKKIGDRIIETHAVGSFSYTDAITAGCFEKETYKKYPKVMISHRAFTYGAREIASDAIMGLMEITELKQINGMELDESDIQEVDVTIED